MTEIKNTVTEMKTALMCSSVDWTQPKKESDAERYVSRNFPDWLS